MADTTVEPTRCADRSERSRGATGAQPMAATAEPGPPPRNDVSLVVGRALGTVVVTVHGRLGPVGAELLEAMVTDLIEGQGNMAVAADLAKATVEPEWHVLFIAAANRARRHGVPFILKDPPPDLHRAVRWSEVGDTVEVQSAESGVPSPRTTQIVSCRDRA